MQGGGSWEEVDDALELISVDAGIRYRKNLREGAHDNHVRMMHSCTAVRSEHFSTCCQSLCLRTQFLQDSEAVETMMCTRRLTR